ncbi:MAG: nitrite/sulfite reductase [Victivallales bacterium]|nr:nitrite/sulfite reductase [Victivallales bacterium]
MENKLKAEHLILKEEITKFLNGELSAADLKHSAAPFGIYQQRDDLFMTRIRITGGHLAVSELNIIADIIDKNNIGYAHLTTRQDIQLQGVPPENIYATIRACTKGGLPFKGGGGNTFRNIAVSPDSGIASDSVFDVIPHAKTLTDFIFTWNKAFDLPRKLKIGFASSPKDELMAATQDLGFVAVIKNEKPGFKVYGGGGMGRDSALGIKLFDFIPVEEVPRCALAMTELFYDHGDRTNRNKARIRFIVKRLGNENFLELFNEYFKKTSFAVKHFPGWELKLETKTKIFSKQSMNENWLKHAVSPTRFGNDVVSVRIFVPKGNLNAGQLRKLAEASNRYGCSFIRLTPGQDIVFPLVQRSALSELYMFLKTQLKDIDLTLESFKGHITCCLGSTVCKIGILDAPALGNELAAQLDKADIKAESYSKILDMIKISGCPNSCAGHPTACIGMQGQKKKIDDKLENVYNIFTKTDGKAFALAEAGDYLVKQDDVPDKILEILKQNFKELSV